MLQKGSETQQTDVNEMLEASKDLIEQVDDEDAVFIRSECRLLTRGYLQLEQTVKGRIEHMQVRLININICVLISIEVFKETVHIVPNPSPHIF